MKGHEKYSEIVCRFMENELNDSELIDFHKELKSNPILQSELKTQQEILNALKDKEKVAFYYSMKKAERKVKAERRIKSIAALSITVLIVAFSLYWLCDNYLNIKTNDELYAEYYVFKKPGFLTRGESEKQDSLTEGLINIDLENYDKAFEILGDLNNSDPEDFFAAFYLGLLHADKGDFKKAVEIIENAGDYSDSILSDIISYYLVLFYIKLDRIDDAKSLLMIICADENGYYFEKAKEIRKELDKR